MATIPRKISGLLLVLILLAACSPSPVPFEHKTLAPAPKPALIGPLTWWQDDQFRDQSAAADTPATGFRMLYDGTEAFEARVTSARLARQHLNIKYYIWKDDKAGQRLIYELINAADRGVQVSVLLDDMDVRGSDRALALLDQHENIQVRVFNPFISRWGMLRFGIEFVFRGSDLNHRMHNKAWIVDGHFAIVGGRNVGDEYFDGHPRFNFSDLDMAMLGPLAGNADRAFVDYWNSPAAVPIGEIKRLDKDLKYLDQKHQGLREWLAEQEGHPLFNAVPEDPEAAMPWLNRDHYRWTTEAQLVTDDPGKATNDPDLAPGVLEALIQHGRAARERVLIVSPYFVPGEEGTRHLINLARQGIDVQILTNSLAATDVVFAHSGYAKRRQALLEGGVELYELKPRAFRAVAEGEIGLGLGASRASLHTKAILFDQDVLFVGSFNLDPRSANINTEMGVITRDQELADQFLELFKRTTRPAFTYHMGLDEAGRVIWTDGNGDIHHRDPEAGFWRHTLSAFAGLLPIESQL